MDSQPEFLSEEKLKELAFDHSMLKVLIIELFRDINIQFSIADTLKFRYIVQYLRPDIIPPTAAELIQMNYDEIETFQNWEQIEKAEPSTDLNANRTEMAQRYAKFDEKVYMETSMTSPTTSSAMTLIEEQIEQKMAEKEPLEVEIEEMRRKRFGESSEEDDVKRRRQELDSVRCVVCRQTMEPSVSRALCYNDAFIMILVCVLDGIYSMDTAQKVAAFPKFKCCVQHLEEMYEKGRQHLDIFHNEWDINSGNAAIKAALPKMKSIRRSRAIPGHVFDKTRVSITPFCTSLRKFFSRFERRT